MDCEAILIKSVRQVTHYKQVKKILHSILKHTNLLFFQHNIGINIKRIQQFIGTYEFNAQQYSNIGTYKAQHIIATCYITR